MLNIHPSLLPAFRGLHTHARALAAGVRVHGCTVHLVRFELDEGPVLAQGVVPVLDGDTEESLAARVLEVEHRCYPQALALLASGRARVEGERLLVADEAAGERLVLHPLLRERPMERAAEAAERFGPQRIVVDRVTARPQAAVAADPGPAAWQSELSAGRASNRCCAHRDKATACRQGG